jgi:Protein of unknown function (DUF3592)
MSATDSLTVRRALIPILGVPAALFFICGVIGTIISSQIIVEKLGSSRWATTEGVVESVSVKDDVSGGPYVSYVAANFMVDGSLYTVQESLERTATSEALAQQDLAEGDPIIVYYDPKDPDQRALIDQRISSQMAGITLVSLLLLFIPGMALSFVLTLSSQLTLFGRILYGLRLFATFLLATSTLVIGMDQTSWLVFAIPAVVILLLIVWGPNLIRQIRGT